MVLKKGELANKMSYSNYYGGHNYNESLILKKELEKPTIYNWNISKRQVFYYTLNILNLILHKRKNNVIHMKNLPQIINKVYNNKIGKNIIKNNQPKSICHFIKTEFGNINKIVNLIGLCEIINENENEILKLLYSNIDNNKLNDNWYFITDNDYII